MFDFLQPHRLWPTRLLCPWDFPGKNTGVGCRSLLQGILVTLRRFPYIWLCCSLAALGIFSLSFTLPCLGPSVFPFSLCFFRFGKLTAIILSNIFSIIFSSSGTPVIQMFIYLIVSSINCCHFIIIIILLFFLLFWLGDFHYFVPYHLGISGSSSLLFRHSSVVFHLLLYPSVLTSSFYIFLFFVKILTVFDCYFP